jgi:hypothetical protein
MSARFGTLIRPHKRGKGAGSVTVIKVIVEVGEDLGGEAWALYEAAFRDLNAMTVQRHLMYRSEFDEVMADWRVDKWLALDGGRLVGLATYANILEAMPLISPAYFERRWPQLYAEERIWYCGFVAVPGHNHGVFMDLVAGMYRHAAERGGVIALDMPRYNIDRHRLDRAVRILLTKVSQGQVRCEEADAQVFMVYETAPEVAG